MRMLEWFGIYGNVIRYLTGISAVIMTYANVYLENLR